MQWMDEWLGPNGNEGVRSEKEAMDRKEITVGPQMLKLGMVRQPSPNERRQVTCRGETRRRATEIKAQSSPPEATD